MTEMHERIAKAIANAASCDFCACKKERDFPKHCACWEGVDAVLDAMREPTEKMLNSGAFAHWPLALEIWIDMIDAAKGDVK